MPTLECPICRCVVAYHDNKEVPFRPFCSKRCKLVDLGRWLSEEYRVSEEISPDIADSRPIAPPNQSEHD